MRAIGPEREKLLEELKVRSDLYPKKPTEDRFANIMYLYLQIADDEAAAIKDLTELHRRSHPETALILSPGIQNQALIRTCQNFTNSCQNQEF